MVGLFKGVLTKTVWFLVKPCGGEFLTQTRQLELEVRGGGRPSRFPIALRIKTSCEEASLNLSLCDADRCLALEVRYAVHGR